MSLARALAVLLVVSCGIVAAAADNTMPTPPLTASTVPVLQWKQTVSKSLQTSSLDSYFPSIPHGATGSDGTGLFLVGGTSASRRRAIDGKPSWTNQIPDLPVNSKCRAPYLPPGQADHLYIICSPNVLAKMWWDTGVMQWSVSVYDNTTTPLGENLGSGTLEILTSIVGISHAYQPAALVVTTVSNALILIDTRTGELLERYVPSFDTLQPQPASPFLSIGSMSAFMADPIGASSTVLIVGKAVSKTGTDETSSIIAIRVNLTTLATDSSWVLLQDPAEDLEVNSYTLSTRTHRLFARMTDAFWMISNQDSWSLPLVDAGILEQQLPDLLESNDGRYLISSELSVASDATKVVLRGIDTAVSPPVFVTMDLSAIISVADTPMQLVIDSSNNIIFINSQHLSAVPFVVTAAPITQFAWSYRYFEDATGNSSAVAPFSSHEELTRIAGVEILPDMQTRTSLLLVSTHSLDLKSATIFALSTRDSPSCSAIAESDCSTCEESTGLTTPRQCAFCSSTSTCAQFGVDSDSSAICPDASFGDGTSVCAVNRASRSSVVIGLIIFSLVFAGFGIAVLILAAYRKRAAMRAAALTSQGTDVRELLVTDYQQDSAA